MRRVTALAAASAVVVLGGCQASVTSGSPEAKPVEVKPPTVTLTVEPGPKPEGRFYAIVGGETSNDNRLYELRFSPADLRLLTDATCVSSVGACDGGVVVAAGQPEVGFSDHIQLLRDSRLEPLESLGLVEGSGPAYSADCRIAYTWVDRSTEPLVEELRVWDPGRKTGHTLYRSRPGDGPLVSPDWGPNGEVAVVRLDPRHAGQLPPGTPPGSPAAVLVVRPDGSTREIPLDGDPGVLAWGKSWMAVMEEETQATVFTDPTSGARSILAGWRPVAWSPDGERLIVKDAATRKTLGVVEASDLSSVKEVARATGPVIDIDWLAMQ